MRKHDAELDTIIEAKYLGIQKACRAWGRGKSVCHDYGFLVNMNGYGKQCSAANNTLSSLPDVKINETPVPTAKDMYHDYKHYNREDHNGVLEGQARAALTEYRLWDMLVQTITIPEVAVLNISIYQQVVGEGREG
jgi:hypothetical protein